MSRVENDREAQRAAERIAQEKRLAEAKGKKTQEGETAFSKLVQQQKQQEAVPMPRQNLGQAVLARATQHLSGKAFDERLQQPKGGGPGTEQTAGSRQADTAKNAQASVGRREDKGVTELRAKTRESESSKESESTQDRTAEAGLGRASQHKGELKVDVNAGGGQGGGGGKDKKEEMAAAAGFRFNPALMAPVPVAQPKPTSGSERLRAIANEIAQKIVERVRVGTNSAGQAEFQMDLRGDVLSGLSIKITAKNGKIQAVFSGNDRDVLKMLQEQSEGLRSALGKRGLKLEDVRFEAR
jgi:flagellar hook-length control protein FliK